MLAAINHEQNIDNLECRLSAVVASTSNSFQQILVRILDQYSEYVHGPSDNSDKAFKTLKTNNPSRVRITLSLILCEVKLIKYNKKD